MNKFYYLCAFLFFALFFNSLESLAQDPQIEWQNTIGGTDWDELNSIIPTSDDGYICAGTSISNISGDKAESNLGSSDFWVIKLDSIGNIEWQNTIGGTSEDVLNDIRQTSDNGFILGGVSSSNISFDKTENSKGGRDYWVVKLDSIGNIEWQKTIGGNDQDWLNSINLTSDGGYICGGYSESDSSGNKTENSQGVSDFWVVKLDANGNIQWENTIGGNNTDFLYSVIQTEEGGFICGGWSSSDSSGDKSEDNKGGPGTFDYWVVKLSSIGLIEWQRTIGGNWQDKLFSLIQVPNGKGYVLGGTSNSNITGDKIEENMGSDDFWIVKLDSIGNIKWQNTIGGDSFDQLEKIICVKDGGYICGGSSVSNVSGDKTQHTNGVADYWIVKLDSLGNIIWQNTIGGSNEDRLKSIYECENGSLICGGRSSSNISGDKNENSQGLHDYWVIKLYGDPNILTGKAFYDINSNNICDSGEVGYALGEVQSIQSSNNNSTILNSDGFFYLNLDTGAWTTIFGTNNSSYVNVNPANHISNFGSQRNQIDSVNFAVQLIPGHPDLCVELIPLTPARPGFDVTYRLIATNVGTDTITGDVQFTHDSLLSLISSSPNYDTYTNPILTWNFSGFAPLQINTYDVMFSVPVPPIVNNGHTLLFSSLINPTATDEEPKNNYSNLSHIVTGSFDPNDKWVNRDTVYSNQIPFTEHLNYLVRFQNTGTDTAFRVVVRDTLDYQLDQSTLNIIHASHDYLVIKRDSNVLEFQFNNILLADSNVNEPASHGYIAYQIKPKSTFGVGDIISNRAAIYFDYNPPILTNVVTTEAVLFTGIGEHINSQPLTVYPNPTNGKITISAEGLNWKDAELILYSALGQVVLVKKVNQPNITEYTIDVSGLAKGVYQLVVEEGEKKFSGKVLVE